MPLRLPYGPLCIGTLWRLSVLPYCVMLGHFPIRNEEKALNAWKSLSKGAHLFMKHHTKSNAGLSSTLLHVHQNLPPSGVTTVSGHKKFELQILKANVRPTYFNGLFAPKFSSECHQTGVSSWSTSTMVAVAWWPPSFFLAIRICISYHAQYW